MPSGSQDPISETGHDRRSLNEMLQELRVLQQGSQILVGFLILLPFSEGFAKIAPVEKWVYIVAFISSLVSLVCFSAPAAQHRIERPLRHRVRFKRLSSRIIIAGTIALSVALISTTQLVLSEVVGDGWSPLMTTLVAVLIAVLWWLIPLSERRA
jgi:hypothetical protein